MPDRVEREIEEILSKLDDLPDDGRDAKAPIPIGTKKRQAAPSTPAGPSLTQRLSDRLDPPLLMISGAVVMIGALALTAVAEWFIWVSLAGIILFLSAFLISFVRTPRPGKPGKGPGPQGGVYWRDRYISYEPEEQTGWSKFKSRFRR